MLYQKKWIEKNMGISRKTLTKYEEYGFIKPARNPNNNKYREYSEEELEQIWRIKFFVKLGYSIEEIKNMIDNPSFDFHKSIGEKLEKLEEEKRELEQLIGIAKFIKTTGIFPNVPQEMGSINFEDFLKHSYEYLNVDADPDFAILYQMLNHELSNPDITWSEEETKQFFEKIISKPESEWNLEDILPIIELFQESDIKFFLTLNSYWKELASLSHYEASHPNVQEVVRKMYDFEQKFLFCEFSDRMTPQWYARHVPSYFSGSDMAILNERRFGKENCEFIIRAIEYFGNHTE